MLNMANKKKKSESSLLSHFSSSISNTTNQKPAIEQYSIIPSDLRKEKKEEELHTKSKRVHYQFPLIYQCIYEEQIMGKVWRKDFTKYLTRALHEQMKRDGVDLSEIENWQGKTRKRQ